MTADEYREKWGYRPLTALMDLETRLKFTRRFRERLAQGWRPQVRWKVDDETVRRLFAKGLRVPAIAARTGLTETGVYARLYKLGLSRPRLPNDQLINLCRQGLWVSEIAARTGLPTGTIYSKLERLREQGVRFQPPKGPRPTGYDRRVPTDRILTLVRKGLTPAAIAARVGIRAASVPTRRPRFRSRVGKLPRAGGHRTPGAQSRHARGTAPSEGIRCDASGIGLDPAGARGRSRRLSRL
jgi:hypothetical protein